MQHTFKETKIEIAWGGGNRLNKNEWIRCPICGSKTRDRIREVKVLPDYDVASVPNDQEVLILIGGMTWRSENTQPIKVLAKDCFQRGKLLCGICDASACLGTAGIWNHVVHTSNDLNNLKQWAETNYTGETNQASISLQCLKCKFQFQGGLDVKKIQVKF